MQHPHNGKAASAAAINTKFDVIRLIRVIVVFTLDTIRVSEAELAAVFHPSYVPPHPKGTSHIEALFDLDAVIIASPNNTHADYLAAFSQSFDGYIFCEKPVVNRKEDLDRLNIDVSRTFVNFNYRYSGFAEAVKNAGSDGRLGKPIRFSATMTQGLAFKADYLTSWRADASQHLHGVTETKAVHQIDLAFHIFGPASDLRYIPSNQSGNGTAYDTCSVDLSFEGGASAHVFASYAGTLATHIQLLGTNGHIEYRNGVLSCFSPRDIFDARGYFAPPPETILRDYRNEPEDMYLESLRKSVAYFLDTARRGGKFPKSEMQASLNSTEFVLNLSNYVGK